MFCDEMERERKEMTLRQKLRYLYPDRIELSDEVPLYIKSRIPNRMLKIEVRFENSKVWSMRIS